MVPNLVVRLSDGGVLQLPNAFVSAAHFASFLESPLYRWLRDRPMEPETGQERLPTALQLVGLAYGTAVHIASSDQPMTAPSDLGSRTSIAPFGLDAMVGAKGYASADLREGLPDRFRPEGVFTQAPTLLLREAVKPELRRYLSLSVTRIVPVMLVADHLERLNAAQRERLRAVAHKAALECSATNFDLEKKEIALMRQEGTQVVDADRPAFRAASLYFQKRRLEDHRGDDRSKRELARNLEMFEKMADPEHATPPAASNAPASTFTFKVCNSKADIINVAYVDANGDSRRVRGWWKVQPRSCKEIGKIKTGDFYFFAQTFNTNPIQVFVNGSKLTKFCIEEKSFNLPANKTCKPEQKRDFSFARVTNDTLTWNL
jgi:uncharacterized membrane protein